MFKYFMDDKTCKEIIAAIRAAAISGDFESVQDATHPHVIGKDRDEQIKTIKILTNYVSKKWAMWAEIKAGIALARTANLNIHDSILACGDAIVANNPEALLDALEVPSIENKNTFPKKLKL